MRLIYEKALLGKPLELMKKDKTFTEIKFDNSTITKIKVDDLKLSFIDMNGNIKVKDRLHIHLDKIDQHFFYLKEKPLRKWNN